MTHPAKRRRPPPASAVSPTANVDPGLDITIEANDASTWSSPDAAPTFPRAPTVHRPPFRLYPESRHWWSFQDYGAVLAVMAYMRPARVLEFGPGSSTLALLEGGATQIDSCEDHPDWLATYRRRLEGVYPEQVRLHRYVWSDQVDVPTLDRERYDLALIDGPYTSERRPPVIEFCMRRAHAVLVPTEDDGRKYKSFLRPVIAELAAAHGWSVGILETGPLSGGFALMTPDARLVAGW